MANRALKTSLISAVLAGTFLSACAPVVHTRGNMVEDDRLQEIVPGLSTVDDVLFVLGTPSTVAPFDEQTWYYIGQVTEQTAFYQPEVVERRVIKLVFDDTGLLGEIDDLSLDEGQDVEFVARETPTMGRQMTFLEQMIGNLGRFNQ